MTGVAVALAARCRAWWNAGLSFFYPEVCQLCGGERAGPAEGYVCATCRGRVRFLEPPWCDCCGRPLAGEITNRFECGDCRETRPHFRWARSVALARDTLLDAIHRYKYQRALCLEPFLGGLLASRATAVLSGDKWDCIVPVPLHPTKQREREFNQAERLARWVSRASGIPLNLRLLERQVFTRTQTQLSREERLENVRGAFALRRRADLSGERILVVDDVLTTGATTSACAETLRQGGAGDVCVWTLARGA